jgi:hypothetical protein
MVTPNHQTVLSLGFPHHLQRWRDKTGRLGPLATTGGRFIVPNFSLTDGQSTSTSGFMPSRAWTRQT